jgi:hypothetical protein
VFRDGQVSQRSHVVICDTLRGRRSLLWGNRRDYIFFL